MAGTLKAFLFGFIAALVITAIIFSLSIDIVNSRNRDKELLEYAQKQIEIESLRENYSNLDFTEFLDSDSGLRNAADRAIGEFERKRDEVLQRFRDRIIGR